ncbi:hypothetical protein KIW84_040325 [Lathyrus oleraceus]|uniref:BED-type domain-containing protein n=1 Tax=Pisum sativum TaxID=3888 RepID=A0A9D5AJY6_PEA|nr:hypothetical protein KIW84_040325 [Pisum sativum]
MEQGDSSREVPPVGLEIMEQEQQDTATEALIPPIDHSRKRRRPNADGPKKKSSCWDHFIELTDVVERTAACKHCHKRYRCDPKSHGTSNMLAHSKICYKNPYLENDLKQTNLAFGSGGLISVSPKFDKEACRKAITLFVILDEHPFRVVDGEGFIFLCNQLEPLLTIPSRRTVARDCFQLYLDEKLRLKAYFRSDCSRVALTTDCWTSIQNLSYITVTAHFVDNDWNYQKRIISFSLVPNHKGETIGRKLEDVLREWGLRNVSTITADNASSNDVAVAYLKKRVHIKNGLMGEADFFHMRCCAHILNLIVNDGLKEQDSSVSSIRNAVRFVRSSPQRALKFKECVEFSRITCRKHLCLDVSTRWNSTYMMLDAAEKFQTAFEKLEGEDVGYVEWFGRHGPPCYTDWEKARAFVKFLKIFYEATKVFSSSQQVSLHTAYHQLSSVFGELQEASMNLNSDLASVGHEMKRKYDKYWGEEKNINQFLYFGVIFDPHYKFRYIEWSFDQVHGEGTEKSMKMAKNVKDNLFKLYTWYKSAHDQTNVTIRSSGPSDNQSVVDAQPRNSSHFLRADAFKQHLKDKDTIDKKNELERSSLSPAVAEGLICTQNWLKPARTYFKDINYTEEFGITEEIISEFQQCFITANIGAAGVGAAVGGATGAAIKMFCLLEFGILFSNVWLAYYETAHLSKSCELKATKLYNRSSSRIGIAELNHGKVNAQ